MRPAGDGDPRRPEAGPAGPARRLDLVGLNAAQPNPVGYAGTQVELPGRLACREHVGDQQRIDAVDPRIVQCLKRRVARQVDHRQVPVFRHAQHAGSVNGDVTHGT